MHLICKNIELSHWVTGKKLGFVPTMGALHRGHFSLVERSLVENEQVIVSIFVNPLQFNNDKDLSGYPRQIGKDIEALKKLGVHAVYAPDCEEIFPESYDRNTFPAPPSARLFEGHARPGHFDGMLTVVKRLFDLVKPQCAYFGEKDAQQLFLVRELVRQEKLSIKVVPCPIVRDEDGLALSSRNQKLSQEGRANALALFKSLSEVKMKWEEGVRDTIVLRDCLRKSLSKFAVNTVYAEIVNDENFMQCNDVLPNQARAIVAAEVEGIHLIDNLSLP